MRALSWVIFRGGSLPSFTHRYCWGLWRQKIGSVQGALDQRVRGIKKQTSNRKGRNFVVKFKMLCGPEGGCWWGCGSISLEYNLEKVDVF